MKISQLTNIRFNITTANLAVLVGLLAFTQNTFAYVGPGAGVSLIGALVGLIAAVGTALWVLFMYPIRKAMKAKKAEAEQAEAATAETKQD